MKLIMRAGDLKQGRGLRTSYQNQTSLGRVGQNRQGMCITLTLFFQPGKGTETGSPLRIFCNETAPGTGQLQQPDAEVPPARPK